MPRTRRIRTPLAFALTGTLVVASSAIYWLGHRAPAAADRRSELWGESGERWKPDAVLGDFSFAGYAMGDRPLPTPLAVTNVREHGAKGDGVTDDSAAFIAALDAAHDGAVLVPAGRYVLTQVLRFERSGVVLRGAGAERTTLYFPKSLSDVLGPAPESRGAEGHWSWGGGFLWLHGEERGGALADVVQPARRGERMLTLSSTAGLSAGQLVRLVQYAGDGSLWEHLHARPTEPGPELVKWAGERLVDFASPIASVQEHSIVLARPLRVDVRREWRPQILACDPSVSEVGVEDLTIAFEPHPYAGHLVESGRNAIFLEGVSQFWIRGVAILDADSGIVSDGISRFGTIAGVRLANDHRAGAVTGHHGISLEGPQDILVTDFRIETRFQHDVTVDGLACGNVFSRGRGVDLDVDHHTGAPYENLFTDLDVGPGTRLFECGGPATGWGPPSAARETFWNVRATAAPMPLPDYPQLVVVGLTGMTLFERAPRWLEPLEPGTVVPQDLHDAQLRRRLAALQP